MKNIICWIELKSELTEAIKKYEGTLNEMGQQITSIGENYETMEKSIKSLETAISELSDSTLKQLEQQKSDYAGKLPTKKFIQG